jgi:hypothetical protein
MADRILGEGKQLVDLGGGVFAEKVVAVNSSGSDLGGGASEEQIGSVGWDQADILIAPTITAGAYAADECVGGIQVLTNFMRVASKSAQVMGMHITDVGNVKATLDFVFFNADPGVATADNAAYVWDADDYSRVVFHVRVDATEYTSVVGVALCSKALSGFPVTADGSANLYLAIITPNAVTYGSTTGLRVRFGPARN